MKASDIVREYVKRNNNDKILSVYDKLTSNYQDDNYKVLEELKKDPNLEDLINKTEDAFEIFDILDMVKDYCQRELVKRNVSLNSEIKR